MNPTLEIFSQGEEIVTGQTVDTNAAWLSQQAINLGFTVTRHTAVGDKLDDLVALLREIAGRADCCICTGGLGPTLDDLTTEAVAQAFALPLVFDATAFAQIQQFFSHRNRPMPESNRKQAMLPQGALRLDNEWGTAPGFAVQQGRCWLVFLPGVPSEMRPIFLDKILPELPQRFSLYPSQLITIKTFGIGESDIQQRMNGCDIPASVQLGFRASLNDVQTKLLFPHAYPEPARTALVADVARLLDDYVYALEGQHEESTDLPGVVNQLMDQGKHTLAIIETASQGLLASLCIGVDWLLESRYEQSLERLTQKMSIVMDAENLSDSDVAKQLALELQKHNQSEFALVQVYTGGRDALADKNQAVTVYSVLLADKTFHDSAHTVAGSIKRKQNQAALLALDLLRRFLQFGQYSKLST
ncbi:MAG: competence/damage-inducible protein A [Methylovulum sp.]|uniref:competence/damage-inducible protein A n=1 Tax=Methylovulum sp. TaxID=1916980 RepID=UPI002622EB11|nr:competence/damage-inducible protein A [Methylovulum sp.]MDD2724119.1 competence/damage-inducible protein A [Methylovulum sp.]MDD5125921.1 competence/damage-inducible protein A [Methylovulum sp.]